MPVILKIEQKDSQRTAIWEVTEDESVLLAIASLAKSELTTFSSITNPGRRLEWLAVRALLKQFYPISPTISYNENGKPLLVNHEDMISITHSGKMVGIAIHSSKPPGIDIEMLHPRIFKIANRFIGDSEREYLGESPSVEQLTIIWCAKEVMFKVYAHGGVTFKTDLVVKPFKLMAEGIIEGVIYKDDGAKTIFMEYRSMRDFIFVQTDYGRGFGKMPTFDGL